MLKLKKRSFGYEVFYDSNWVGCITNFRPSPRRFEFQGYTKDAGRKPNIILKAKTLKSCKKLINVLYKNEI